MKTTTPETLNQYQLQTTLVGMLTKELRLPEGAVDTTTPLTQYGLDSIAALTIAGDLEDLLGLELPPTLLWDCPTIADLASSLDSMVNAH